MGVYDSCKQKIIDSKTISDCSLKIPVNQNQRLIYSKTVPSAKIIKRDPFLNLYLVEDEEGFNHPFKINSRRQLGLAAVNETDAYEGKIVKRQVGLNSFAIFSDAIVYPSVLTSSCCSLEGLVTPEGVIEKAYLKRFISMESASYSDVGIRVKNVNSFVEIVAIDPYFEDNPFQKGDRVLELNGKKIRKSSIFAQRILFSKLGSLQRIQVKRDGKIVSFGVKSHKRYGGGYVSDTFLEQKGVYFDSELCITKLVEKFKNHGLNVGDRLLQVNGTNVTNQEELKAYIANFKDFSSLLLERDGFQFFVQIN